MRMLLLAFAAALGAPTLAAAADRTPPVLRSAVAAGATVTLTYSEPLSPRAGSLGLFLAEVNGAARKVRAATVAGSRVRLTIAPGVWSDDAVAVVGSSALRDRAGNRAQVRRIGAVNTSPAGCSLSLTRVKGGVSEAPRIPGESLAPVGAHRVALVFVDFLDTPADEGLEELYAQLGPPATEFFRASSFGRLSVEYVPTTGWVRVPGRYTDVRRGYRQVIARAIAAADAEFDFSAVDGVVLVIPRATLQKYSFAGSPAYGEPFAADGHELPYTIVVGPHPAATGEREPAPWRILVHETAHWFGLPDLYDLTGGTGDPVGTWDPMSVPLGQDFLAWHKWNLGWIDPPELRCLRSRALELDLSHVGAQGGVKAVAVSKQGWRALVVEARLRSGYDAALCGEGVLVYDVDTTVQLFPVVVQGAEPDPCAAALGVGSAYVGEGVRVEVLARTADGYRVRVTRA